MDRVITADTVVDAHGRGELRIAAPRGQVVITPGAWTRAQELGVTLDQTPTADATKGGVVVVRGRSLQLGDFAGAPNVKLKDVVTSAHGSPMTAGFMSWRREDSFAWALDYDEIDYVLEGVLHLGIDGHTHEARAGDVLYIPKGSRVMFGTPSRVRVFYVTYPADWAGPKPR